MYYDPYTQVKISWSGNEQAASANIGVVIFFPLQDREVYYIWSSFPSDKVTIMRLWEGTLLF